MKHAILILIMAFLLHAAPAFQHPRVFQQPDGSRFTGTLKGDEYLNWIESQHGDIVVFDKATHRYEAATVGKDALHPSGKLYRIDTAKKRKSAPRALSNQTALKTLWLKKREEKMILRKKIKN